MSEFESSSGLKTSREDFDSPIKPGKQIIAVPGDSTKEKAQHGKITIEVLNKEVRPILIAPQFPEGQYFVISTRPKRDTSPGEQFTKWKGKLEKVLQHTRDFMFSSCEDQNTWRGKHITADTYCEVKISLFISLTNGPVGEIEVHSCLERGDQLKYAEFYLFLERKFSNIDVGIPVHPNMFPPTMTNVVTVDDSLCKEYAFSLLKMIRNSKHSNARVAALRSLGRLQMPANNILQDDEIGEEVVSIVDQLWNFNNSTDIEKEHTIFVMQRLIQSLEDTFLANSESLIQLVHWILRFFDIPDCESYKYVQSVRVAADVLRKLSQRKSEELMTNLVSQGFEFYRDQLYEVVGKKGVDPYTAKALIEFRNSYS